MDLELFIVPKSLCYMLIRRNNHSSWKVQNNMIKSLQVRETPTSKAMDLMQMFKSYKALDGDSDVRLYPLRLYCTSRANNKPVICKKKDIGKSIKYIARYCSYPRAFLYTFEAVRVLEIWFANCFFSPFSSVLVFKKAFDRKVFFHIVTKDS